MVLKLRPYGNGAEGIRALPGALVASCTRSCPAGAAEGAEGGTLTLWRA
jgi:hypothetical protein